MGSKKGVVSVFREVGRKKEEYKVHVSTRNVRSQWRRPPPVTLRGGKEVDLYFRWWSRKRLLIDVCVQNLPVNFKMGVLTFT